MESQNLLIKNGNLQECKPVSFTAHDLLQMMRGAYTTARSTMNGKAVFEFGFHVHRLMYTSLKMLQIGGSTVNHVDEFSNEEGHYELRDLFQLESFTQTIREMTKLGIEKLKDFYQFNNDSLEFKITLVIVFPKIYTYPEIISPESIEQQSTCKYNIYLHLCPMPKTPTTIHVDVHPGSRFHWGNVKDTYWAIERSQLGHKKLKTSNEVIMCEQDGSLREGISSNFFAILKSNGKTLTADEGVLIGSTRAAVIPGPVEDVFNWKLETDRKTILSQEQYEIVAPNLSSLLEYEEVFITSTSRLMLPIKRMNISKECFASIPQEKAQLLLDSKQLQLVDSFYVYEFPTVKGEELSQQLNSSLISKSFIL